VIAVRPAVATFEERIAARNYGSSFTKSFLEGILKANPWLTAMTSMLVLARGSCMIMHTPALAIRQPNTDTQFFRFDTEGRLKVGFAQPS
tara:strand:+ start:3205 stop:3474 length:270 start_codon:yes stop_codon:yes gene_type:complete